MRSHYASEMQAAARIAVGIGVILLLLTACSTPEALPTLVAPASLPDAGAPVAAANVTLPGTFTPLPPETAVAATAAAGGLSQRLLAPSGTPYIPTRTPYVTAGPPTRTPLPTPTPTGGPPTQPPPALFSSGISAAFPYPPITTGSKLGIHVIRNNDPGIMNFVRSARPAVIKVVDDLGFLEEVKRVSPQTVTIGRVNDPIQNITGNPEEEARKYVQKHLRQYLANRAYVDYWEGWNEPDPGLEGMGWYARFEAQRVREMARYGLRTAVGGFATGVPELDEFALFVPAIEAALQYGGILTLHEYGAPEMTYLYGAALPGYPAYPDRGALTFRYRWFYREILEPAGLVIPLAITEAGIDGIIGNRPGPSGYGWKDFQQYGVQRGWGQTGVEAFINQLAWYDRGVREDPYVIGFTVFTAGPIGHWREYDINGILPQLADHVNSNR